MKPKLKMMTLSQIKCKPIGSYGFPLIQIL